MLRISLTGPESTGKTTLAVRLAAHYGTAFAPEYAREYLADNGPRYTPEDLEEIARGQLAAEATAEALAHRLVFCDSDLLVIKIWAEHSFGTCPEWILQRIDEQCYDLVYRHAVAVAGDGRSLLMASTTGGVWSSDDAGDSWHTVSTTMPPVYAVSFACAK